MLRGARRWRGARPGSRSPWTATRRGGRSRASSGGRTWADDASLATLAGRKAREDEIEAAIAAWAAERETRAAAAELQAAGVAAAPVIPTHELFPDPQLQDCGYWALQFRAFIDDHFTPEAPFRYDGERPPVVRPAPTSASTPTRCWRSWASCAKGPTRDARPGWRELPG